LLHRSAQFDSFYRSLPNYNIIHIASHAQYNSAKGEASIDFFDTSIATQFFYGNGLRHVRLVFLSACETAVGQQAGSEGVLSLARSVYYAGAQNVISSQWKINDASTAKVVSSFYANSKKVSFCSALQQSKISYLTTTAADKAAPYYWAAFNLVGVDDSSTVSFFYRYKLPILSAIALLVGILGLWVFKRSKTTK
jgi:CHAT domain-containing protein